MKFEECVIVHRPATDRIDHERWSWHDVKENLCGGSFRSLEECLDNAWCRGYKPRTEGEVLEEADYMKWVYENFTHKF